MQANEKAVITRAQSLRFHILATPKSIMIYIFKLHHDCRSLAAAVI